MSEKKKGWTYQNTGPLMKMFYVTWAMVVLSIDMYTLGLSVYGKSELLVESVELVLTSLVVWLVAWSIRDGGFLERLVRD